MNDETEIVDIPTETAASAPEAPKEKRARRKRAEPAVDPMVAKRKAIADELHEIPVRWNQEDLIIAIGQLQEFVRTFDDAGS